MSDQEKFRWLQAVTVAFGSIVAGSLLAVVADHLTLRELVKRDEALIASHYELVRSVDRLTQRMDDWEVGRRVSKQ